MYDLNNELERIQNQINECYEEMYEAEVEGDEYLVEVLQVIIDGLTQEANDLINNNFGY